MKLRKALFLAIWFYWLFSSSSSSLPQLRRGETSGAQIINSSLSLLQSTVCLCVFGVTICVGVVFITIFLYISSCALMHFDGILWKITAALPWCEAHWMENKICSQGFLFHRIIWIRREKRIQRRRLTFKKLCDGWLVFSNTTFIPLARTHHHDIAMAVRTTCGYRFCCLTVWVLSCIDR